ncbi:hypothetical protein Q7P37_007190 [Cladosporium fusiforme]
MVAITGRASIRQELGSSKPEILQRASPTLIIVRREPPTIDCEGNPFAALTTNSLDHAEIMQTLWSRIAQTSGAGSACKCPQCLTFASGLTTRRAGAAATRRAPKYLTSSTLWYSGIFAAAATLDAGMKVRRRDKWDRAIAEMKEELGKEEKVGLNEEGKPLEKVLDEDDVVLYRPDVLEEAFGELEPTFKQPRWPVNTGPQLQQRNLAPESIYAHRGRREKGEVRSWSPKKIETMSLSVDLLQLRIMIFLINSGVHQEAALSIPEEYGANLSRTLDQLHAHKTMLKQDLGRVREAPPTLEGYERAAPQKPLNIFGQAATNGEWFRAPRELNLALQSLLKEHKRQRISTPALLARICYNLSVSSLPPNLDTYNTLLLGLSVADQTNVVTHVIRSLKQCNLRPNETSIAAILNHYTVTDDAPSFVNFVETMRGKHLGLSLARPDIQITAACNGRLVPKEGDPTKVIQLPYPTPKVFAALIAGVTKFGGFDTALGICKNMGEEGWGLCMSGLAPLLQDCAERRDWEAGLGVWQQVQQLEARSKRQGSSREHGPEKIPMRVYAAMLRLCLSKGEKQFYDEVWEQATNAHRKGAWTIARMVKDQIGLPLAESPLKDAAEQPAATEDPPQTTEKKSNLDANNDHGAAKVYPASSVLRELRASQRSAERRSPSQRQRYELLQEQLYGSLPASDELEQYEVAERPMYLRSSAG